MSVAERPDANPGATKFVAAKASSMMAMAGILSVITLAGPRPALGQEASWDQQLALGSWVDLPAGDATGLGLTADWVTVGPRTAVTLGGTFFSAPWAGWWTFRTGVQRRIASQVWLSGDASIGQVSVLDVTSWFRREGVTLTVIPRALPAQLGITIQEISSVDVQGVAGSVRVGSMPFHGITVQASYGAALDDLGDQIVTLRTDLDRGRIASFIGFGLGQIALQKIEPTLGPSNREVFGGVQVRNAFRFRRIGFLIQHRWSPFTQRSLVTLLVGM